MGCAECHDHKFDPVLTKDFYSMKAFFADIEETGLVPDRGLKAWGTQLLLAPPDVETRLTALKARWEAAAARRERIAGKKTAQNAEWKWEPQRPSAASSRNGSVLRVYNDEPVETTLERSGSLVTEKTPGDGLVMATGPLPDNDIYSITLKPGEGVFTALLLEAVQEESLPGNRMARGADRFVLSEVELDAGASKVALDFAVTTAQVPSDDLPAMAAIDGDSRTGFGLRMPSGGRNQLIVYFQTPVKLAQPDTITVRLRFESEIRRALLGRMRFSLSRMQPAADLRDVWREAEKAEAAYFLLKASVPHVMSVEQKTEMEVSRVLPRGNFLDDSGEIVEPAIPAFLGKLDTGGRKATRLDLANWLVSRENPLTARVYVNRVWRQLFGTGLSKVLDDLGSQGEWPTHPELLDWLAFQFQDTWDMKRLMKTIVMSQTYRQASTGNAGAETKDPGNRLLARQNRFRVDAETVRDIALAASGLLVEKFGGPSVKPVQPEGYLAALNFPKRDYSESRAGDLYRRGLYTHWQRTFLHPSLAAFDAPTREECVVNRSGSNTPLQALVLLNDPIYIEASRVFAQNILASGGVGLRAQLDWAFERALARLPTVKERQLLIRLHAASLAEFTAKPKQAAELISIGEAPRTKAAAVELAAMTNVARAILNLSETITRN
jgi:PAS domain-containing protein